MNPFDFRNRLRELIDLRIALALQQRPEQRVLLDAVQFKALLAALQGGAKPPPRKTLVFTIRMPDGIQFTGVPPLMLTMKDNQSVSYTIAGKDSAGNPAPITGPLTAAVSDPTVLSATVNADNSITVQALGPLSTAAGVQLTVTDTGDGGLTGTDNITIIASSPTTLVLTPGTPA